MEPSGSVTVTGKHRKRKIPDPAGRWDAGFGPAVSVGRNTFLCSNGLAWAGCGGEGKKMHKAASRLNQRILRHLVAITAGLLVLVFGAAVQAQARSPAPAGGAAAEAPGLGDFRSPVEPKPPRQPPSLAYGVDVEPIVQVGLGAVDVAALLQEDAARARIDKVLRYGLGRDIVVKLADGRWYDVPGEGRLWVVEVVAEAANGIRLHFVDVDLPPGAQLFVYAVAQPERLAGPYEDRGIHGDGQFWSPTRFDDRLRVEYFVPSTAPEDLQHPAFAIDRLQHIYRDPFGTDSDGQSGTGLPDAPDGRSRSGACDSGGCTNATDLYPDTLFSTSSNDWTTFTVCAFGGEHSRFWVESGHTYEWSACTGDGAASCSWDSQFMLRDTSGNNLCYSDDWCGYQSKIRWMATFTGEVHLARMQYNCTTNEECATLVWRRAPCRLDVTCYPGWANEASAVGGIGYINSDSLYCSGQLLNNLAGDWTPYWLTANHCLDTQAEAQSGEIYWFYQSSTCDGTPPALSSVPQSAVCTLLATGEPTDYTLLMVEGELPGGLWWAGWTAAAIADDTAATGIHHPAGSHKRISFGSKSSTTSTHHWIDWNDGGTEGGSSGSGIFKSDSRHLIGQLSGNVPDCYFQDNYGAFSVTYPDIAAFMAGGTDDEWEQNDSCTGAVGVAAGTYGNLIVKGVDEDWYKITIPTAKTLDVNVTFTDAWGDIDIALYDACNGTIVASSDTTTNNESFSYRNCGTAANYYLRVYLYSDQRNTYGMTLGVSGGEHCHTPPNYNITTVPADYWQTTGNITVCAGGCRVYRMWLDCANSYDFSICAADAVGGAASVGDGDFTMYDSSGSFLWYIDGVTTCDYDASTLRSDYAGWTPPSTGYYYLQVDEYNGGPVTFNLAYKYSAPDPCAAMTTMSDGVPYSGTLGPCGTWSSYTDCAWDEAGEEKVYKFTTTVPGVYTLTAEQPAGDVDFYLMSRCNPLSTNIMGGCWSVGAQTVTLPAGELYYWIVDNYSGTSTASYAIKVDYPPVSPSDPVISAYNCGETVVTRSGSPPSGITWYWQGTSCGMSTDLGSGPFYSVTSAGTYYLRARHDGTGVWSAGCGSLFVEVNMPPPDPTNAAAHPSTICAGGTSTLTASVSGAETDWYRDSCTGSYVGTGTSVDVSLGLTSTFFARARYASTGCSSAGCDSATVTVIPHGGACGDPADTDCDNPDTCDGAGNCVDNHEPDTAVCEDGVFCNGIDTCSAGVCAQHAGDPCNLDEWCYEAGDACISYGNGDFEPDGDVDLQDFAEFQMCFGQIGLGPCAPGKMIGGGIINLHDLVVFEGVLGGPQ